MTIQLSRHPFHITGGHLAVVLAGVAIALMLTSGEVLAQTNSTAEDSNGFVVQKAQRTVMLTGFTRARHSMSLVSESSARVKEVRGDVGDALGADGVFAKLDSTFTQIELAGNRVEQSRLRSEIEYKTKEADRYRKLVGSQSAAQSALDLLVQEADQARHQLELLKVTARRLSEELERLTLKGPAGWKVMDRIIEPGEWINAGQKVAVLGDYSSLLIPFALAPEEYRWLTAQPDDIFVILPDYDQTISVRIERISPAFDPETRKINVDLLVDGAAAHHRGGIRVELAVQVEDQSGAVIVPRDYVAARYDEHWVALADGAEVKVVVLGDDGQVPGMIRVTAPELVPGTKIVKALSE